MKKQLFVYINLVLLLLFVSCSKEETNYTTNCIIAIEIPQNSQLQGLQGTITLTNLSNGNNYSSSTFQGNAININAMRGVYSVSGQGTIRLLNSDGSVSTRYFRVYNSYVEAVSQPTTITLTPVWL